ncbi:MAG: cardiolipin synthase [Flavisolibacter sp.]
MNWMLIALPLYTVLVILVCLKIVYDTRTNTKALAYLLVTIFLPVLGAIFYFSFGINYRKHKMYSKKINNNKDLIEKIKRQIALPAEYPWHSNVIDIQRNKELAKLVADNNQSPITGKNKLTLLINGENKFPEVVAALQKATHHIHLEYYIYSDHHIGNLIKEILISKAKQGVQVRFIYDAFGSHSMGNKIIKELKNGGVQVFPFYKILFWQFANRLNYRNHRKIIVIDGSTAFVGGINVSDQYINKGAPLGKLFWRDTHMRIDGPGTYYLQYLFMCDWDFCSGEQIEPDPSFFCLDGHGDADSIMQIVASGPDSDDPVIMFSIIQAINLAKEEILITSPYFIPGESVVDALTVAALSGISVKLLVPGISDSRFINAAACSYYSDLLEAGVEIFRYNKGFVHAKTLVADSSISIVGTANMDYRSFELNFEVNCLIYDQGFSQSLRNIFYTDIQDATQLNKDQWNARPLLNQLFEKVARLLSPLL